MPAKLKLQGRRQEENDETMDTMTYDDTMTHTPHSPLTMYDEDEAASLLTIC